MQNKIEAGRNVADHLLRAERVLDEALAETTALKLALVSAQGTFQLAPAVFEKLVANVEAAEIALHHGQRHQKRAHLNLLRLKADEGLDPVPFGCDKPTLGITGGDASLSLTPDEADGPLATWVSSSASSSFSLPPAAMPFGEAGLRSGLPA